MSGLTVLPMVLTTVPACTTLPSASRTPVLGDGVGMRLQADDNAAGLQAAAGVITQRRGQLGQELRRHGGSRRGGLRGEGGIKAKAIGEQVVDLTGHLDTAEAAADDRQTEEPAAAVEVGLSLRVLQLGDHLVAQRDGVAQRLEGDGVGRRPRDHAGIDRHAAGQHEVLVWLCLRAAALQLVLDPPAGEVQASHDGGATKRVLQELPDRPYHVQRVDGRADDLGQHRREGQEVFLAKEDDLPVPR